MSPIAALRSRRSSHDLPPETTDEELLAWSGELVHEAPRPVRQRGEPLRAERRIWVDGTRMSTDELLDEIERRAAKVAGKPRLVLRRS